MLDTWEKDLQGLGDGKTKLNVGTVVLPKYIVYAEIYDFSVSYAETYDKGKLNKTNTTIIGIQIRMVNVDNSQYIVASGQGTSTQQGEGFFKNPKSSRGCYDEPCEENATEWLVSMQYYFHSF